MRLAGLRHLPTSAPRSSRSRRPKAMTRADGARPSSNARGIARPPTFTPATCGKPARSPPISAPRQGARGCWTLARGGPMWSSENFQARAGSRNTGWTTPALSAVNRRGGLVYCSITGFGQTGPYAHRAGYAPYIIQGMSGLIAPSTGPGRPTPRRSAVAVTDIFTGCTPPMRSSPPCT